MTTELKIEGMSCNNCVNHVKHALEGVKGVQSADVDLATGRARVEHDGSADTQALVAAVVEEGYTAEPQG